MTGEPAAADGEGRRRRRLAVLQWVLSLGSLAVIAFVLRSAFSDVEASGGLPGPLPATVAVVLNLIGNLLLVVAWQRLVRLGGSSIPLRPAASVWATSQVSRLIFVGAPVGARAALSRLWGVRPVVGAVTTAFEAAVMVLIDPLLALATLPWWADGSGLAWLAVAGAVPAAGLIGFALSPPPVLRLVARSLDLLPVLDGMADRLRSAADSGLLDGHRVRPVLAVYGLNHGLRVLASIILLAAIVPTDVELAVRAVGAYALGRFVGGLAVFAPGGIGPREGAAAAVLAPAIGAGNALLVAAAARVAELVAEALFLLAARVAARNVEPDQG